MTEPVWDPTGEARRALELAVREQGLAALSNPNRLDNLLRDLLPDSPREASLIVAAAQVDLSRLLGERVAAGVDVGTAIRLAAGTLGQGRAFDPSACRWVAREFALARGLGVGSDDNHEPPDAGHPIANRPPEPGTPPPAGPPLPLPGWPSRPRSSDETAPAAHFTPPLGTAPVASPTEATPPFATPTEATPLYQPTDPGAGWANRAGPPSGPPPGQVQPGGFRTGDLRTGDKRTGDKRTGDLRTGDKRTGDRRSGGPGPGDPPPAAPGGPRGPATRRTLVVALIVVAVLILVLGGGGAALVLSGGSSRSTTTTAGSTTITAAPSSSTTTGTTTTTVGLGSSTTGAQPTTPSTTSTGPATPPGLTAIGGYLAQSAMARADVAKATQGVEACNEDPGAALQLLNAAIALRQGIANNLPGVDVSGVAGGAMLRTTLRSAINHSLAADHDFVTWLNDVQTANRQTQGQGQGQGQGQLPCSLYMTDASWQAGNTQSVAATNDKTTFVAAWNPLATRYGLQTYPSGGF